MVLLSRRSAGYTADRFVFEVNGKVVERFFDDRYTNEQAINMMKLEARHGIVRK